MTKKKKKGRRRRSFAKVANLRKLYVVARISWHPGLLTDRNFVLKRARSRVYLECGKNTIARRSVEGQGTQFARLADICHDRSVDPTFDLGRCVAAAS